MGEANALLQLTFSQEGAEIQFAHGFTQRLPRLAIEHSQLLQEFQERDEMHGQTIYLALSLESLLSWLGFVVQPTDVDAAAFVSDEHYITVLQVSI
jgi:ATP-dependent exoDNAse (exonuclease V) beta subunit